MPGQELKHKRNLAQRLLSGAAWAFAAKFIGVLGGLVVNALLARMLPPDELGAYFLLTSIVMFAAIGARFGLKQTVVRLVAESMVRAQPGRAGATLRIVYCIVALGACAIGGGYYLALGDWLATDIFATPALGSVTGIAAIWIAVLAFQTPVAETFRGLHDIRLASFLDGVLATTLLAVAIGISWYCGLTIEFDQAVALSVVTATASLLVGTVLFLRRAIIFKGEGSITAREVVAISSPIFVTNLSNQAMTNFSLWIVGAFLFAEDVALYGSAWKLVMLVALPLTLINMSVQPIIAELHATNEKHKLQNALRGTATLAALPSLLVLVIFIALGSDVLGLVYGAHYREAAPVLAILSIGHLVSVWTGSCALVLAFTGHHKELMYVTLTTSAISVALAIGGVMNWGLLGVAAGVATGRVLQNITVWLLVRRLTGIWTHATISPGFIGNAAKRLRG